MFRYRLQDRFGDIDLVPTRWLESRDKPRAIVPDLADIMTWKVGDGDYYTMIDAIRACDVALPNLWAMNPEHVDLWLFRTLKRLFEQDMLAVVDVEWPKPPARRGPPREKKEELGPAEEAPSKFEITVLDDSGRPVEGLELRMTVDGTLREAATNGAGHTEVVGKSASTTTARFAAYATVKEAMRKPFAENAPKDWSKVDWPDEHHRVFVLGSEPPLIPLVDGKPFTLVLARNNVLVRLIGFYFDTSKSFILPKAMVGIRGVKRLYGQHPGASLVVVGHTDTAGKPTYNNKLSLERATAVATYLTNDVDKWTAWFADDKPDEKRWGTLEVQYMLSTLPEGEAPFYAEESPSGLKDPKTKAAIKRFQAWSRETRGSTLDVDGNAGKATREELVKAYMDLDNTTLPEGTSISAHGAGESFPADPTPDGEPDPDNRRVEIFIFDYGVYPPAPSEILPAGSPAYLSWRAQVIDTMDVEHQGCRVRVVDELGNVIANAWVTLDGPHKDEAMADEAGIVTFFNLSAGTYTAQAEKDGYVLGVTTFTYPPDPTPDPSKPTPLLDEGPSTKKMFFHDSDDMVEV